MYSASSVRSGVREAGWWPTYMRAEMSFWVAAANSRVHATHVKCAVDLPNVRLDARDTVAECCKERDVPPVFSEARRDSYGMHKVSE